jgi:hypothetical protein
MPTMKTIVPIANRKPRNRKATFIGNVPPQLGGLWRLADSPSAASSLAVLALGRYRSLYSLSVVAGFFVQTEAIGRARSP